jgi:hypothetical protein
MRIIKNEKLIKRNGQIGQWTSLGSMIVLGVGMYFSFRSLLSGQSAPQGDSFYLTSVAFIVGLILFQIGIYFSSRFGRSPRPDEQLDAALKGLPGDTSIYHYTTPVPHLLVGPAGIWLLLPFHQRGKVTYYKNRWRLSGGGFMQSYMTIFGEGIGRPDLEMANQIDSVKKYLAKQLDDDGQMPEIQGALVFTSDQIEIDNTDAPSPALKAKQLKDFMRQKAKERALGPLMLEKIKSVLPFE